MATQATSPSNVVHKVKEEIAVVDREVGAAFIASGIGSLVLGLLIIVTEMKAGAGIKAALNFVGPVGPLSGKTTISVIAFVVGWAVLHFVFKSRPISLTASFIVTIVLVALGFLFTYPPFFVLFAK